MQILKILFTQLTLIEMFYFHNVKFPKKLTLNIKMSLFAYFIYNFFLFLLFFVFSFNKNNDDK